MRFAEDPLPSPATVEELEEALDGNRVTRARLWKGCPGYHVEDSPDIVRTMSDTAVQIGNTVAAARLGADASDRIAAVLAEYQQRNFPLQWWVGPTCRPPHLADLLEAAGLEFAESEPGMAADLDRLDYNIAMAPETRVEKVQHAGALREYANVFIGDETAEWAPALRSTIQRYERDGFGEERAVHQYLARWDGRPAATLALLYGAGVAGVINVGTLPEARGRGLSSALMVTALADARDRGYHVATLTATEMGEPVYRRLGFERFCDVSIYRWRP